MKILYESETIRIKNNRDYFSVDESLINHKNNRQLWLIGAEFAIIMLCTSGFSSSFTF